MSGGGAKGSFELGVVDYLIRDAGVDPEVIVGVSTGNLNAVMLAQGKGRAGLIEQLDKLMEVWTGLRSDRDIYTTRFAKYFGFIFKADSIYSNEPAWKLIQKYVDPAKLKASGRILRIGVVGLKSGEYFSVDGGYPYIREMVRASASIPVFFNPVDITDLPHHIDRERFVDGGVRNVTPLSEAFDALASLSQSSGGTTQNPDTIHVVLASPLQADVVSSDRDLDDGIDIGKRSLSLLVNEVYRTDLQLAMNINLAVKFHEDCLKQGLRLPQGFPFAKHRYVNLVLVEPAVEYMDSLDFDAGKIAKAINEGRQAAQKALRDAAAAGGTNLKADRFDKDVTVLA
jgi:predicted acylesterase/phospholipase RssA